MIQNKHNNMKKHEQWRNTVWFRYSLNLIYITAAMYLSAGWIQQQPIRPVTYQIFKYANDVGNRYSSVNCSLFNTHFHPFGTLISQSTVTFAMTETFQVLSKVIWTDSLVCLRFPTTTISMSIEHNHYIILPQIHCVVYTFCFSYSKIICFSNLTDTIGQGLLNIKSRMNMLNVHIHIVCCMAVGSNDM